mgnify:CR=1 FL=1
MENEATHERTGAESFTPVPTSAASIDIADTHESNPSAPAEALTTFAPLETPETGDVRVDAAIARLTECATDDDPAAIAVLTDVYDRLHHVLLNP